MKPKLDLKKLVDGGLDTPGLANSADTIAWIRELALSISLSPPPDDASVAEFKQYAWNHAMCQAIVEISDRLLNDESAGRDKRSRFLLQPGPKPGTPLS
jgi:hypothetical protein